MIQATVAVYPLQQMDCKAVHQAIEALQHSNVEVTVGAMHTTIAGDDEAVFQAIHTAYQAAAASGPTVMTATLSNACPVV